MKNLIRELKQTKFRSYGLSLLRLDQHDETTEIFKDLFDNWIDLGSKSDQEIIDIIQNIVGIKFVKPFVVFKKLFEAIPNITAKNKYRYPEILKVIIVI